MNPVAPDSRPEDLDALIALCDTLAGFSQAVDVEWVDGYLTGLAAAGRSLEPEDWLEAMFEGDFIRAFADPPAHAQAVAVLQARLDVLRRQLDAECLLEWPDRLRLNPWIHEIDDEMRAKMLAESPAAPKVDGEGQEGEDRDDMADMLHEGVIWASGFLDSLEDHPDWWPDPPSEEEAGSLEDRFEALLQLQRTPGSEAYREGLELGYGPLDPDHPVERDQLITDAMFAVQELRLWQIDHAPKPATVRVAKLPGRNEPCWCGSGKKFKKCHGA